MAFVINAKHIIKYYYQASTVLRVLNDINIEFVKGHSYGIIGESGSGKSTLLHLLGGLDEPSRGTIEYNGVSLQHYTQKEKEILFNKELGFVFQFHYLINECTVYENIIMPGRIRGKTVHQCEEKGIKLLEEVGLVDKKDAYPYELSGGEQQRVSIARALFNEPSFILADEPTGSLDHKRAIEIIKLLEKAQQEWGLGLIICSHDPAIYSRLETVYELAAGKLKLAKR